MLISNLLALVLVASAAIVALTSISEEPPASSAWAAAVMGVLGLVLSVLSSSTSLFDFATVFGVVVFAGIKGAGWNPKLKNTLLVLAVLGLFTGAFTRFFALFSGTALSSGTVFDGTLPWFVARAAGLVAFLAATGAILLGSRRQARLPINGLPARIYSLHRAFGIASLLALAIHLLALKIDTFIDFSWTQLLILPWTSTYRPLPVTLGWLAMISLILTAASGGLRRWLPGWRTVHLMAYATFALGIFHGFFAGSDASALAVRVLYLVSLLAVGAAWLRSLFLSRPSKPHSHTSQQPHAPH